jgi:hypothetical protein
MDTLARIAAALRIALSAAALIAACTGGWAILGWTMAGAPPAAAAVEPVRCDGASRVTIDDRLAWRIRCDGRLRIGSVR